MSADERAVFSAAELLRWQEAGCQLESSRSDFYAGLLGRLAADAERGDPRVAALLERAPMTIHAAPPLRLLGGLHRGVLTGEFTDLAATWPDVDGTGGDIAGAHREVVRLLAEPPATLLDTMTRDPQTNEVGRAAVLAPGLAFVAAETGLPIRVFEIGASAGLNLRLERYSYSAAGARWGDSSSPLRFTDRDYVGTPPLASNPVVVERRGCDIHPIDATTADGATTLLSYVWPDQSARITRLRAALAVARDFPVTIDAASADEWVDERVRTEPGTVTVLMHSVMWQYLPPAVQQSVRAILTDRGGATDAAPIVELALEPGPTIVDMDLTVTRWPDGAPRLLARCGGHGPPLRWGGDL